MTGRVGSLVSRLALCARTDAGLLLRAIGWRMVLPLAKNAVPLSTLTRWMSASPRAAAARSVDWRAARVSAVQQLLAHGGRFVVSGNCLERSLVLYRFLGEAGADPQLVMGVSREAGALGGHAWVELDGEPMADAGAARFVPVLVIRADGMPRPAESGS